MQPQCGGAVGDVVIDDQRGLRANLRAQFDNFWDYYVMGEDFAHFFLGAQVNGESGRVGVEQDR